MVLFHYSLFRLLRRIKHSYPFTPSSNNSYLNFVNCIFSQPSDMRFRTAIIWNGISQFGQSGITLLSTIILARILTPDDFGIIGIVTIFIAFSQMIVDSEMGGALLRKKNVSSTDYSTLFYYNLGVSLIIYILLFSTAPLIADFYSRPQLTEIIRVISVCVIIHAFRVVQKIMIFRELKFHIYAIITSLSGLISLGTAIWLAYIGYGYWALVWQQIVLASCNVIFMGAYNRFIPKFVFSKSSFKYQFYFGISLLGSNSIMTIGNNISANIIAKISTLEFTGYYTQVSRITNFCQNFIGSIMDQSIFPILAKFENALDIKRIYNRLLCWLIIGLGIVTATFIFFAENIILIVLGKEWTPAAWIFQILSIAIIPASIQILCRNILKTFGKTKKILYIESIKSIILIISLIGSAFLGMTCVVWAIVLTQLIGCGIWMIITNTTFCKEIYYKSEK